MMSPQQGGKPGSLHFAQRELINGRYLVERLIGQGRMGYVYLVADTLKANRLVALKTLINLELSAEQLAMLKNEFEVMSALSHPNLAAVYDFEGLHASEAHFMTMEYVSGTNLETTMTGMHWRDGLDLIVQVCRALAYMHSRSVIHFDLKPANIMVSADKQVKVLDFGLSGARSCGAGGGLIGTPAYLAPELALSPGTADHRVDIYALGIILYRLISGRMPFKASTLSELIRAHCFTPLSFDQDIEQKSPGWLRRIVTRMCAKEPADRFRTANAIIEELNSEGGLTYELETRQTRESYLLSSRFVAREDEFKAIVDYVENAMTDGVDKEFAFFVGGVSGIGKSRLLKQVRHHLQLSRLILVESNCYEESLSEFAPIIEAVRHIVALLDTDEGREVLTAHGPELATLDRQLAQENGWTTAAASENPEAERLRTIQHVVDFILDAARISGFALYVNDLQWALPGTVDILAHLLRTVSSRVEQGEKLKFCLLGSYREDEVEGKPLAQLLSALKSRNQCRQLSLSPLTDANVGQLLGSMLGIESPPAAFVKRVHEESGGNPFFVEEIMRMLVENGAVFIEDGKWATSGDTQSLKLPHSVADALAKRFALLDKDHRMILELMAVHGQPVSLRTLQCVLNMELSDAQQRLITLTNRRMAVRLPGSEASYRIVHDRLRESIQDAIPTQSREKLHRLLAMGLLKSYSDRHEEVLYDLARHFWEAGDREQSLTFCLKAAEKARSEYANELGIVLYRRLLQLMPLGSDRSKFDVLEKLGELSFLTGAYQDAMECYQNVLDSASEALTQARLRRKQALVDLARGELNAARDKLWEAAAILGSKRPRTRSGYILSLAKHLLIHFLTRLVPSSIRTNLDEATRAWTTELSAIYIRLVYVYYFTSPLHIVLPALMTANTSQKLGPTGQLCHAHCVSGVVYATAGMEGSARRYGEAAISMAKKLGMTHLLGQAHEYRGMCLFLTAHYDEAIAYLNRGKHILSDCGDLFELEVCYIHLSWCYLMKGKYAAAQESNSEALRLVRETDALQMGKNILIHAAMANAKLGNLDGARREMEQTVKMCEQMQDVMNLAAFRVFLGDMLLIAGEADDAIECLETARRIREEHGIVQGYSAGVYAYLVRAHWEKHLRTLRAGGQPMDSTTRKRLCRFSRKAVVLGTFGHPVYLSPGLISRGLSLWLDGRKRAAQKYFRAGIEAALKQRADMWLAEGYYEAGRALILSAETRSQGISYLQQAERLFREQEYRPYLERARTLLQEHEMEPAL